MTAISYTPTAMPAPARRVAARPRQQPTAPVGMPAAVRPGWLERLALWADAQPAHRRLGSWTLLR